MNQGAAGSVGTWLWKPLSSLPMYLSHPNLCWAGRPGGTRHVSEGSGIRLVFFHDSQQVMQEENSSLNSKENFLEKLCLVPFCHPTPVINCT